MHDLFETFASRHPKPSIKIIRIRNQSQLTKRIILSKQRPHTSNGPHLSFPTWQTFLSESRHIYLFLKINRSIYQIKPVDSI